MSERYDTALICVNGHIVTDDLSSPHVAQKFCKACGKETIWACPECNAAIHGAVQYEYNSASLHHAPKHCHQCGKPYPWTISAISAAKEMVHLIETDPLKADVLANAIEDLTNDGPRTTLAVTRFQQLKSKASKEAWDIFKNVISSLITQSVKQQLFG